MGMVGTIMLPSGTLHDRPGGSRLATRAPSGDDAVLCPSLRTAPAAPRHPILNTETTSANWAA